LRHLPDSIDSRLAGAGLPPLPRRLWAEIDEAVLADNLAVVRELVGPGVALNAVIKADAYGHGLVPVARVFAAAGADRLCVTSLDEALVLRAAGMELPIVVLFGIPPGLVARAAEARVEIVAAEESTISATLTQWRRDAPSGAQLAVHVEVETGLARAGLQPEAVARVAGVIATTPGARLAGLWSHLARSENEAATAAQVARFERAADMLRAGGLPVPPRHIDATGGLLTGHAPRYDGVRVGLALYGILPDELPLSDDGARAAARLRPAMTLKARPLRIERLAAGTPVGYGGLWQAPRESLVATLPVGYGDGWPRATAPHAQALVHGCRVPLVGSVAMDAVMADVTDVPDADLDDEYVLLGRQASEEIRALDLARARNTIPYEVVTSVAHRVPRVYHAGPVLKGLRTLTGEARAAPAV
jgi:alanine racemase